MNVQSATAQTLRVDAKVIALVGSAHFVSHFFQLALPPLFPMLKQEFGVSYAMLGAVMSVFFAFSGVGQTLAGFAVDRFSARAVLLAGMGLLAASCLIAGLSPTFWVLFPVFALAGVGNSVFHPADFSILNASVAPQRLGHAYSVHGIGGNLGWAAAPMTSFALGSLFGWRAALIIMGGMGLASVAFLMTQRASLVCHHRKDHAVHYSFSVSQIALLLRLPVIMCFAYFCFWSMATVGVQTFSVTTLTVAYHLPLALATTALTGFLLAASAGILAGGFAATQTNRHGLVAAGGMLASAFFTIVLASAIVPSAFVVVLTTFMGFFLGMTVPSRDMLVRAAAPSGATGRVYGLVYSGVDFGASLAPLLIGWLLDRGHGAGIFIGIAGCMLLTMLTAVHIPRFARASAAA